MRIDLTVEQLELLRATHANQVYRWEASFASPGPRPRTHPPHSYRFGSDEPVDEQVKELSELELITPSSERGGLVRLWRTTEVGDVVLEKTQWLTGPTGHED